MLIKLNEGSCSCDTNDRGTVVDASINPVPTSYPAAIYISGNGFIWNLQPEDFEIMNVIPANVVDNY